MIAKRRRRVSSPERAKQESTPREWPWVKRWLGPGLIVVAFVGLTAWSWRKWAELLVDFGQQLYIPWQLASGKHLYEDIAFIHGPFSQYFNAFWFRVFGPSLTVLVFVNLCILAGVIAVIYRIIRSSADRLTATSACLILVCVFGFSQYVGIGNYNYVCPYTHEATHGIALTAGMVLLLSHYLAGGGRAACAGAGLCLGFALLTKADVAVAATIVAGVGLAAGFLVKAPDVSRKRVDALLFGATAAAPALGFFLYFLSYLPAGEALTAIGGRSLVSTNAVATNPFYRRVLGTNDVGGNIRQMLWMFWSIVVCILPAGAVDIASSRLSQRPLFLGVPLGAALCLGLILEPDWFPWREIPRALPLTTLLAFAVFARLFLKYRDRGEIRSAVLPMLLWTTLSLVLLGKIALNVHIYHYGFYLAMPAALALVACLTYWIPRGLKSTVGCGLVFRSLALGVLCAGVVYHLRWSQEMYSVKNFAIGRGDDTLLTYAPEVWPPGVITAAALQWIDEKMPAGATFAALPEGIMLNYLSRRTTTLPQINFMMAEMIIFGEEALLAGFKNRPPDYVVLVHRDTSEFGVGPFGIDRRFGLQTMDWVNQHYEPAIRFGAEPFRGDGFGIKILRRRR